jgi:hypothetical protein
VLVTRDSGSFCKDAHINFCFGAGVAQLVPEQELRGKELNRPSPFRMSIRSGASSSSISHWPAVQITVPRRRRNLTAGLAACWITSITVAADNQGLLDSGESSRSHYRNITSLLRRSMRSR